MPRGPDGTRRAGSATTCSLSIPERRAASSTANAIGLGVEHADRLPRCRPNGGPAPSSLAVPARTPAATRRWPSGASPSNSCPTLRTARRSPKPRLSALRCAAASRPGSSDGRMSVMSAAIGLASFRSGSPPPKQLGCRLGMNDQVTASIMPRDGERPLGGAAADLQRGQDLAVDWSRLRQRLDRDLVDADPCA